MNLFPSTSTLFPYTTLFRSWIVRGLTRIFPRACLKSSIRSSVPSIPTEKRISPSVEDFKQRSEEHTSELQSPYELVCRLLLEKKNHQLSVLAAECIRKRSAL